MATVISLAEHRRREVLVMVGILAAAGYCLLMLLRTRHCQRRQFHALLPYVGCLLRGVSIPASVRLRDGLSV